MNNPKGIFVSGRRCRVILPLALLLAWASLCIHIQAEPEIRLTDAPWITISTPMDCSIENIEIPFVLFDNGSRPISIHAQYSLDGGATWHWAWTTRPMEDCMSHLASAPNGVLHFFPWYATRQASCDLYQDARIRIRPFTDNEFGPWVSTEDFCVDNLFQTPWLTNYGATRTNRCHIPIYYRLRDCTSEATDIYCAYSLNSGKTWHWAWQGPYSDGQTGLTTSAEGVLHTFMWDAAATLPETSYIGVRFAILPFNTKGMSGYWKSPPFDVTNSRAPWVALYTPPSPASCETIRIYMRVFDYQSLPADVRGWYSVDGGETWNEASTASGGNLLSSLAATPAGTLHYFPWDALSDLGEGMFGNVKFAVRAENSNGIGDREETASFGIGFPIVKEKTIMLPGNVPLTLVKIPAGTFQMGSPGIERSRLDTEGPVHTVNIIYDFYMGKYEVTQKQWLALMKTWPDTTDYPGNPIYSYGIGDNFPAYFISWNDAKNFIKALNLHIANTSQGSLVVRLPSESEWEYACRAGTRTRFFFGDSLECGDESEDCAAGTLPGNRSDYFWYSGNNASSGQPGYGSKSVGTKLPNQFGLYDMHGNVWEWCEDDWHGNYNGAPVNGSAWVYYPRVSSYRVIRGGNWRRIAGICRSADRYRYTPTKRYGEIGIRLAADVRLPMPTPTPIPGQQELTIMLSDDVPLTLVKIPSGIFQMGSPVTERGRTVNEGPVHTVNIEYDFYMGKYEVTQAQWLAVMKSWPGAAPSAGLGDNFPAYNINWNDMKCFITALNTHIVNTGQGPLTVRLPSESEWEYSCRAGTKTRFFFGDSLDCDDYYEDCAVGIFFGNRSDYFWYRGNNALSGQPGYGSKPVGTKLPNQLGLHDMHGNVWELCEDDWHPNYNSAPTDGSAWMDNPRSSYRVIRGGGWHNDAMHCRSAYRDGNTPTYCYSSYGFRLAADHQ